MGSCPCRFPSARLFKFLEGGEVEVQASFPAGKIGTTLENLEASVRGENEEHTHMYPTFAKEAREEGFENIAQVFESIAQAEIYHESRFKHFAERIKSNTVFKQDKEVKWVCRNCGYVHTGAEAPDECPACAHPQAHYQLI